MGIALIGRIDPTFDREARVLRINAIWAEERAPGRLGNGAGAILESASGLAQRACPIRTGGFPSLWRRALMA